MANPIEGYASATSVVQGRSLDLHVRSAGADKYFSVQVHRVGATDTVVGTTAGLGSTFIPTGPQDDATLAQQGCAWPVGYTLQVDPSWSSGLYYAQLTGYADAAGTMPTGDSTKVSFVVTPASPGSHARILLSISDTTYQAYNEWGGRSLYSTPYATQVSYDRPYLYDTNGLPIGDYERPFIQWAERNGIAIDYCSNADLQKGTMLNPKDYALLVDVGHDEYWTKPMFDNAQSYIGNGGNMAFLSGNDVWWQARLENNDRTLVCYKYNAPDPIQDPARGGPTLEWPTVGRPGNTLVGAGFTAGAFWPDDQPPTPARLRGYTVQNADSWVYAGTGLKNGDVFGQGTTDDNAILGNETDAARYAFDSNGIARPTGTDGSPLDFNILGYADLTDWPNDAGDGQPGGYATMGYYKHGAGGTVFTAGTINWAAGLRPEATGGPVDTITHNLMNLLG